MRREVLVMKIKSYKTFNGTKNRLYFLFSLFDFGLKYEHAL